MARLPGSTTESHRTFRRSGYRPDSRCRNEGTAPILSSAYSLRYLQVRCSGSWCGLGFQSRDLHNFGCNPFKLPGPPKPGSSVGQGSGAGVLERIAEFVRIMGWARSKDRSQDWPSRTLHRVKKEATMRLRTAGSVLTIFASIAVAQDAPRPSIQIPPSLVPALLLRKVSPCIRRWRGLRASKGQLCSAS